MLPHSPAPITAGEYFIFGRNYSEITKPEKIIHMCSLNSSGWLKSHLILKSIEVCLGAWVRGIMRVIDHFWTLEGWMGGRARINHLISRESTMDIGVGGRGGGSTAQFWLRELRGRKRKEKGFPQKLKRIFLHLEIKFCPQFSTKGKVNLIIKHLKLNKRKKNGFV